MNDGYRGIVPYLFYDDAEAAMAWYARVFGFEEIGRWSDDTGKIQNAEMRVGNTELWLDGSGRRSSGNDTWIGVWVDDVAAVHERVKVADNYHYDVAPDGRILTLVDIGGSELGRELRVQSTWLEEGKRSGE